MSELLTLIKKSWRVRYLKRKYYQLSFQGNRAGKESLQRQMAILKSKRSGCSEEWYLEKIIYDLQRDRR